MSATNWPERHPATFLMAATLAWVLAYRALLPAAEGLVGFLAMEPGTRLEEALRFFFYDTPKVLLLLAGVVMVMGMVNSHFTPERTRALLAGRREGVGNGLAASLGIVTPFCSCSAVPLFIGFVQAGVPLGITFSFLIAAPIVNEVGTGARHLELGRIGRHGGSLRRDATSDRRARLDGLFDLSRDASTAGSARARLWRRDRSQRDRRVS